jgi:hypothetical protein
MSYRHLAALINYIIRLDIRQRMLWGHLAEYHVYNVFPLLLHTCVQFSCACVAQWLEQRRKKMMILTLWVEIQLWDLGAGHSDATVYTEVSCRSGCST